MIDWLFVKRAWLQYNQMNIRNGWSRDAQKFLYFQLCNRKLRNNGWDLAQWIIIRLPPHCYAISWDENSIRRFSNCCNSSWRLSSSFGVSNSISIVNDMNNTLAKTINAGSLPIAFLFNPSNNNTYVASTLTGTDGLISVIR